MLSMWNPPYLENAVWSSGVTSGNPLSPFASAAPSVASSNAPFYRYTMALSVASEQLDLDRFYEQHHTYEVSQQYLYELY